MKRGTRHALVVAALALVGVPVDGAQATTWDGRCTIEGTSTFDEPIGALPAPATYSDVGTGLCTGTLDGRAVEDAPIRLAAVGEGTMGCLGGTATMPGTLTFTQGTADESDDVAFGYVGESAGVFPNFVSIARGAVSGRSIAYVNMLRRGDPGDAEACRDGTMAQATWDAVTQTLGPNEG